MVVAMIVLFVVVVFVVFLLLYSKWCLGRVEQDGTTTRRRRIDFAASHHELASVTTLRHRLDPTFLKSIPILLFSPKDSKDGLECSVCLSEVSEGENIRLLPECNHGFHVECIDMWFSSHSTCPICRNHILISIPSTTETQYSYSVVGVSAEGLSVATNVLVRGSEVFDVSTLASVSESNVT